MSFEWILIIASLLLLASALASKVSDRFGVPALLLFLALGMLAGSDGPGGIYFDDPNIAQFIGVAALNLILFSGGLDTNWNDVRPVLKEGIALSTLGVVTTTLVVGAAAFFLLDFSPLQGLLLGAIVSSTDAAAVFSILRSKSLGLKGKLRPLLELESGSNDPMAVFLTVSFIQLLTRPDASWTSLPVAVFLQIVVGALCGYLFGRLLVFLANRVQLGFDGLYPALTVAILFLAYGTANLLRGNGFLAVYLTGIVAGNYDFVHRRSVARFHDGAAWLMQIAMFLTLGLLVFPSQIPPVVGKGFLVAGVLIFLARPVSVFVSLIRAPLSLREKIFISWVGLRGAAPIILATYPLTAGLEGANEIFNLVFFVVFSSALLQGTSIPYAAKWLNVDEAIVKKPMYPIEYTPVHGFKNELKEIEIPPNSAAAGKTIVELGLPQEFLIILTARGGEFILPSGALELQAGDILIALSNKSAFQQAEQILTAKKQEA